MLWIGLALIGALLWLIILLLPWTPWRTDEFLDADPEIAEKDLSDITLLIPARNEAEVIETTFKGLKSQGTGFSILLVDDESRDDTVRLAREAGTKNLRIIPGTSPPPGWTGKLWALQQGYLHVKTPLVLLMDADIDLKPGILKGLLEGMKEKKVQFLSLMASLPMNGFWERLLMPAFIYFFKLLYPFRLSNSEKIPWIAAAAGGCILLEKRILDDLGGFEGLRGALIDDCALAKKAKSGGYKTWIALTHSVQSLRTYDRLSPIWNMVARTAYTQLHYSPLLLTLCTLAMGVLFLLPPAGIVFPDPTARGISGAALLFMMLSYLPTLSFYGLNRRWALALPVIGFLFLAMTWTSAFHHWLGEGAEWKGRSYLSGR